VRSRTAQSRSARYERGDHILDGRTGRPATGLLGVTVVAPTLTEADTVATAAFALGAEGVAWAAAREHCEVFAVDAGRRVLRSAGFPVAEDQPPGSASRESAGGMKNRLPVTARE
jgi:thiamine biosynthesis lipoprotein